MARGKATTKQTATDLAVRQQKRVQRRQQQKAAVAAGEDGEDVAWEVELASLCSEGYNSEYSSDCSNGDREAEVVAATMGE